MTTTTRTTTTTRSALRRLLAAVLGLASAVLGVQLLSAPPAAAGQLGLTIKISGAAAVTVIEGSLADGAPVTCDMRDNLDHREVRTCPRVRSEAVFSAVVWLRVTPLESESDTWIAHNWQGCDAVRRVDDTRFDCKVASDSFGSVERTVLAGAYDATRPEITTATQHRSTTDDLTSVYEFATTQGELSCRADDGDWFPCTSPLVHRWPAPGVHRMHVRATDTSGNLSDERTMLDTLLDTTVRSGPATRQDALEARFVVDSPGAHWLECSINGGDWHQCGLPGEPFTVTGIGYGTYELQVRGAVRGSRDELPASWRWTMGQPPQTVLDSAVLDGRTMQAHFHAEPGTAFQCRLDGPEGRTYDWLGCQSPVTLSDLPDGDYHFKVRATDAAGHVDDTPVQHTFTVRTPVDPDPAPALPSSATVVRVVDADTLLLEADEVRFRADLAGLTPPTRPRCVVRSGRASLTTLARPRTTVRLAALQGSRTTGSSPWTVLAGRSDLAQTQLTRGLARLDTREAPSTRRASYAAAQQQARRAHRGLWGGC